MNARLEMLACRLKGHTVSLGAVGLAKIKGAFSAVWQPVIPFRANLGNAEENLRFPSA